MRVVVQRVSEASVSVDGETIAQIGPGLLLLAGIFPEDGETQIDWLADKILGLRIFPDAVGVPDASASVGDEGSRTTGKAMNRSVMDVNGSLLVVSQFTLAADLSRGKRPGFSTAAAPEVAQPLFNALVGALRQRWPDVQTGRFGADMQVALINDGPVTFLLER